MKKAVFFAMVCAFFVFAACDKDDDNLTKGELSVKMRTWNSYEAPVKKSAHENFTEAIPLKFVDMKGYKYEMKVTKDEITDGVKDADIEWITIYQSEKMKGDSERDFNFKLPVGDYKGFGLWQGRDFFWVGEYKGKRIEIPSSNGGDSDRVYNVFGTEGLYVSNSGKLEKVNNNEKIGVSFSIKEGKTTNLTIRVNFNEIMWYDNDGDGKWSNGDEAGDPIAPDGITTMSDFIVVYEGGGK